MMERIIIFTGKGGVGKTSVAAAHARKAALQGKKTLLVSADMAHNLGDLFGMRIGREITQIAELLYGLEIDPEFEMDHNFSNLRKAVTRMLPSQGQEEIEDLSMLPGMEELFSLLRIQQIYESREYEVMIVDCAPTGETLSLLKFPELFSWYMEKLFPIGKVAMRILHPVSQKLFQIELPDGKAMNDIEILYGKLIDLQELLKNREVTSIRLVTLPEKMVVEETKRNYMYLNLYNFNVDGLFINRVLPQELQTDYFDEWLKVQQSYIEELLQVFGQLPVHRISWYDVEIEGMEAVDRLVADVLAEENILEIQNKIQNEEYIKTKEGYSLKICLPGVDKDEIVLHENGLDLILRIGNFKRCIPLPAALRKYQLAGARLMDSYLIVRFISEEGGMEDE